MLRSLKKHKIVCYLKFAGKLKKGVRYEDF